LVAEGYSKCHQKKGFQKYLDDAMGESNETIVSLCHTKDLYHVEIDLCTEMIEEYNIISKQLFKLSNV
jgi:four helix bundle protein